MKILAYMELMRLHSLYGALFAFFPCLFALINHDALESNLIFMFLGLSIFGRSFGCVINDIIDAKLDKKVERTATRPIPSGKITRYEAFQFLIFLCVIGLYVIVSLTGQMIMMTLAIVPLIALYPLYKRVTYFPAVFLGFVFNLGALFVPIELTGTLSLKDIYIYLGCICWTISYDTMYGLSDYNDDIKNGIKSMAIKLKNKLYILHFVNILCLIFFLMGKYKSELNISTTIFISIYTILTYWEVKCFDFNVPNEGLMRFKFNVFIGIILALILL